jgi:hypothetical protein
MLKPRQLGRNGFGRRVKAVHDIRIDLPQSAPGKWIFYTFPHPRKTYLGADEAYPHHLWNCLCGLDAELYGTYLHSLTSSQL